MTRLEQIRAEHAATMRQLRTAGERALREERERHERSLREWDERERARREEGAQRQRNEDALRLARRTHAREHRTYLGLPLTHQDRLDRHTELVEQCALYADDPKVVKLRRFVEAVCAREHVFYQTAAAPELLNGSAVRSLREILIAPIQSLETAAVSLHELGHVLGAVDPTAPSTTGPDGKMVCVSHELSGWRWALDQAPVWTASMHETMRTCLESYRPYATAAEHQQMDDLCSRRTLVDARLRCAGLEK